MGIDSQLNFTITMQKPIKSYNLALVPDFLDVERINYNLITLVAKMSDFIRDFKVRNIKKAINITGSTKNNITKG